jgi:hypothetical protein
MPPIILDDETSPTQHPAEFQSILRVATPEMDRIVREVFEPNQPVGITLAELRDLFAATGTHRGALSARQYNSTRRNALRDAIRLLDTAQCWFAEEKAPSPRPRSVEEVVQASRPWRARLKSIGEHAFVFEPEIATQFADINTTGTLEEEQLDLEALSALTRQHKERLMQYGLTEEMVARGQQLLLEANGRDLFGILGLRNREDALYLRNRLLTYATLLGKEARAAGINTFHEDEDRRKRFEQNSLAQALRKLNRRRTES